ncbi:MAG: hypothetical protein ACYDA9_14355 [Terriglobia bacterium]
MKTQEWIKGWAKASLLLVALGFSLFVTGCRKTAPPVEETSNGPRQEAAAEDTSYLPQDVFGPEAVPGATVLKPIDPHSLSESELKYGIAPKRTSEVEYQPGVIVMEQGDKAIRSIASNGMEWQFDANAPHVSEFQEGKIVFATGRAVGRIISMKKEGDSVTIVLGPIQLTDVIKNGKFRMDSAISADNMISYVAPDFPQPSEDHPEEKKSSNDSGGAMHRVERAMVVSRVQGGVWTPMSVAETYSDGRRATFQKIGDHWSTPQASTVQIDPALLVNPYQPVSYFAEPQQPPVIPGIGLQAPQAPANQNPPLTPAKTAGTPPVVDVGDIRTVAVANPSYIGLQFYTKNAQGGLSVFAETLMNVNSVHMHFVLNIVNGRIVKCGIDMGGAVGVKLYMDARSMKDFQVNLHKKWWEPVDLTIPLGIGNVFGVPFSVTFNMMLDVNSGFSAKQSILHAEGDYNYKGGLWAGYSNGSWQATTASEVTARTDMGRSIQGISLGINSLVMACSVRAMVGIGAFGFNTGVYVGMRFDGTILRAPDEAFPCKQGTIEVFIDSGVGYSLPGFVVDVINKFLSLFTKYQMDRVGTILKGPSQRLFHGNTQIPGGCSTAKQGGG